MSKGEAFSFLQFSGSFLNCCSLANVVGLESATPKGHTLVHVQFVYMLPNLLFIHQAGQSLLQIFPLVLGLGCWRLILPVKTGVEAALRQSSLDFKAGAVNSFLQTKCLSLDHFAWPSAASGRSFSMWNTDHLKLSLQPEIHKNWGKKSKQKSFLEHLNVPSKPYKYIAVFAFDFWPLNSPSKAAFHLQNSGKHLPWAW